MNALLLRYRFRLLFAGTVLLIIVLAFPHPPWLLERSALLLFVLVGVNTLRHRGILLAAAIAFGVLSLLLAFLDDITSLPPFLNRGLALISFYGILLLALFHRVTQERPVTTELLYGLCALYLQLGLAFAIAYELLEIFWPGSFTGSAGSPLHLDSFVYFSLVTLSTVGYGDIQAVKPIARLLAISEAVIGVLFIALAVARGMSLLSDADEEDV
ncbi:voltage-gated potassium channel [compost metagenome]